MKELQPGNITTWKKFRGHCLLLVNISVHFLASLQRGLGKSSFSCWFPIAFQITLELLSFILKPFWIWLQWPASLTWLHPQFHPQLHSRSKPCPFSSAPLPLVLLLLPQNVLSPHIHSPCLSVSLLISSPRDPLPTPHPVSALSKYL